MLDYLTRTGRKRTTGKKLLGTLEAYEILLYTPLLRWYIEHGLELQAVYTTIEYQPGKILAGFVDEVTDARRMGDTDKEKAIFAELSYTKDEKTVDRALRSAWFEDLTEIADAYEITSRKPCEQARRKQALLSWDCRLPASKTKDPEFYHDFLDRFVDRKDFELIQMDTDRLYFALSANKLEEVVKSELQTEFENRKKD